MSFGTVDALAINAPSCGSVFAPATPGVSNAIYWSDYNLTPVFTSQSATTNTITAQVTTNFTAANVSVVRDSANSPTVPSAVGHFTALGPGAPDPLVPNPGNRTPPTRSIRV